MDQLVTNVRSTLSISAVIINLAVSTVSVWELLANVEVPIYIGIR